VNIVFFGSSKYSIPALEALLSANEKPIVITTPDQPSGRHQNLSPNPLASFAFEKGLTVLKPDKLDGKPLDELKRRFRNDFGMTKVIGVCCVYGKIIPQSWLDHMPIINIHPSLLPKYRGPSPATFAILNNEKKTGVSFLLMDDKVDHGPTLAQFSHPIVSDDTADSLYQKLFSLAAEKLPEIIKEYYEGEINPLPQNHGQASTTRKLIKNDGLIPHSSLVKAIHGKAFAKRELPDIVAEALKDGEFTPEIIDRLRRALSDWPGIFTKIMVHEKEMILKIKGTSVNGNKLVIEEVQLEGKNPVIFSQFSSAYPDAFSL